MTDEEIAEKYAIENYEQYEEGQTDYKALKQAHLAGLKEGKQQNWHDLTKDPNDLPPADPFYPQCSVHVFSTALVPMYYIFKTKEWVSAETYKTVNPTAWYHIPDYEWEVKENESDR